MSTTFRTEIEIDAPGADGDAALRALVKLVESKFDEE